MSVAGSRLHETGRRICTMLNVDDDSIATRIFFVFSFSRLN